MNKLRPTINALPRRLRRDASCAIVVALAVAALTGCQETDPARPWWYQPTQETDQADRELFLEELKSDNPKIRFEAWNNAHKVSPDIIVRVGILGGNTDQAIAHAARQALRRMVHHAARPGQPPNSRQYITYQLGRLLRICRANEVRRETLNLLGIVGTDDAADHIATMLSNVDLRDDARMALERLPGPAATNALIKALSTRGDFELRIIEALGQRGDKLALPALKQRAADPDRDISFAAINALSMIGEPAPEVFSPDRVRSMSDEELDQLVDAFVRYADKQASRIWFNFTGREEAHAIYLAILQRTDAPHHKYIALQGLGEVVTARDVDVILPLLTDDAPEVQAAAEKTLSQITGFDAYPQITQAIEGSTPHQQASLLRIAFDRDPARCKTLLNKYLQSESSEVRIVAAELMGESDDPSFAANLLAVAGEETGEVKSATITAYLKLADVHFGRNQRDDALNMYHQALELADEHALRAASLRGIASVGSLDSVERVKPLLDGDLNVEAGYTLLRIAKARQTAGESAQAIALLEDLLTTRPASDVERGALDQLRDLGVDAEKYARAEGFLTRWHIIGPFPNPEKTAFEASFFPEESVDLAAGGRFRGQEMAWSKVIADRRPAVVDLAAQFDPNTDVAAYAYTTFELEGVEKVTCRLGSSDGVVVWLNGEKIHANNASRSLAPDEDRFDATVTQGENELLIKVLNDGGEWGFCMRLTDADGNPIEPISKGK